MPSSRHHHHRKLLASPPTPDDDAGVLDSDVIIILSVLLCALICVAGIALVARCVFLRRRRPSPHSTLPPPPKGLQKDLILSLPKLSFSPSSAASVPRDCPICLNDFAHGDELRVLPVCSHAFHVACIDAWLSSHSSCPSCRRSLLEQDGTDAEAGAKRMEDPSFLP